MIKKFISMALFLGLSIFIYGQQLPNSGFENWTKPKNPDGWYTYSSTSIVNMANKDESSKVEGTASAKIQTTTIGGSTTFEILSLGTATYTFGQGYTYFPIYFPYRPDTMRFAYKYVSSGIDTATAYIKLSKANKSLLEKEIPLTKNESWSIITIDLTTLYSNSEKPDSILVQFKSSKVRNNFFGVEGSTLNIDNIHMGYKSSSSIKQLNDIKASFVISPNPFTNQLTLTINNNQKTTILLYDFLGKEILEHSFYGNLSLNTENLSNGIYSYRIKNDSGIVKIGKLIKN